jgi:hypothetical protein
VTHRFLAFDIETSKITPDGDDIQNHRPLGICCWAIAWVSHKSGEIVTKSYCGTDDNGSNTAKMTRIECVGLVQKLRKAVNQGYTLLTHNGCSFDLDILAEESGMHRECCELAMNSVDTCLLAHCHKGFPVGLEAIAKGMGLSGKTEGMSGALAPQLWAEGRHDEVLAYCAQDVRSTLEVALEIERRRALTWISKSGRRNHLTVPKLLTVAESLQLPEPNTSWMKDREPIPRSRFTAWMQQVTA